MPLIRKQFITSDIFLGIWKIEETVEVLKAMQTLTIPEELFFSGLKNETRKKHWLSYRLILKEIPGVKGPLDYDCYGKPCLPQSGHYVSVSHSGDLSAIMVSREYHVGLDIERIKDRIERISQRFLSNEELNHIDDNNRLKKLYVAWGTKEAVYKIHGKPDVDFIKDIIIKPFDFIQTGDICKASLHIGTESINFELHYEQIEEYMLVYTWKKI